MGSRAQKDRAEMSPIVKYLMKSGPAVWYSTAEMAEKYRMSRRDAGEALLNGFREGMLKREASGASFVYAAADRPPMPPPTYTNKALDPFGRSRIPASVKRLVEQEAGDSPAWKELEGAWR